MSIATATPSAALRALLTGIVDYAGLFPPATLGMGAATAEYARQRAAAEGWMLGRFVLPAARLDEFAREADRFLAALLPSAAWQLAAVLGPDVPRDAATLRRFNRAQVGRAQVDAVEFKASSPGEIEAALLALPTGLEVYVELHPTADLPPLLHALKTQGARAKLRTGGLVPDAIPAPEFVAHFVAACHWAGVPFKATAGLHHPVRHEYPLSYAADAPVGTMHGFLNVFVAAALLRAGRPQAEALALLREDREQAFAFDERGLTWRGQRFSAADLQATREQFALGFGSCSFAEPVADLRRMGVL